MDWTRPTSPKSAVIDGERLISRRSVAVGQTPCSDNTLGVPVQQDDFLVTAPHRGKLTQIDEYPDGVARLDFAHELDRRAEQQQILGQRRLAGVAAAGARGLDGGQARGILVSSAVMGFEQKGLAFNLLITPGQQDFARRDFSEDTDRALTAVDSAVMLLDAAPKGTKGASRSRLAKLFEVCRLRDVPIISQQARPRGPPTRSTCWTKSSSRSHST